MISLLTITALAAIPSFPEFVPAPREFRAAWVATVDNIDWPSKKTLTTELQQAELKRIFSVAEKAGLNAIVFQIRPSCDSLYFSKIEPWSEFLTGQQGKPPDPYWDPLEFAIEEAHARGIELHAWFNPYRAKHFLATGPLASNHIFYQNPQATKKYGRYLWLDPGEPATPKRTLDVILDVVNRYDLDGVHIDDYFYPYAESDSDKNKIPFPDNNSFQAYLTSGGTLDKKDWRRKNVNDFVKNFYESVKRTKPWVKVGISPFGIARPNQPEGIKAGVDQYDDPLYADCRLWFAEGWCDYFTPQLYWPIDSPGQPYGKLLEWWAEQNEKKRHLWPGNYTSRMIPGVGSWKLEEVTKQIELTRKAKGSTGNVHFSFKVFLKNEQAIVSKLGSGLYKSKALVPDMPWLGKTAPKTPVVKLIKSRGETLLRWASDKAARSRCVYQLENGVWRLTDVLPGAADELVFDQTSLKKVSAFAVTALSPVGIESKPAIKLVR